MLFYFCLNSSKSYLEVDFFLKKKHDLMETRILETLRIFIFVGMVILGAGLLQGDSWTEATIPCSSHGISFHPPVSFVFSTG